MLCQFTYQNFKSYKGETTLDLNAATLTEFKDEIILDDGAASLLPLSVIYGPNGGGKTNLIRALACVISAVVRPISELRKNHQQYIFQQTDHAVPFLFDEVSATEPTQFQLFIRIGSNEYCYFIAIRQDEVVSESLYSKAITSKKSAMIFERDDEKIDLGYSIRRKSINTNVNPKMPYLSFLAINYDIPVVNEVVTWFEGCIVRNYAMPKVEQRIMLSEEKSYKDEFLHALHDMDIDIEDYRFDEEADQLFLKRVIGAHEYELPFAEESEGTRKLIASLPLVLLALREGRLMIVDELDAKLHPKLLRYVISLFHNKKINRHGAQLLFTSHDMYTLKNTVFRRDEIWFAAENETHESELYSLHDIYDENHERVKNTAAYDKQYMEGRYGADPYLSNMLGGEFE